MGSDHRLDVTTMTVRPDVRDRLKTYRDENEHNNLSAALSALLDEAGVDKNDNQ